MTTRSGSAAEASGRHGLQHRMIFTVSFAIHLFAGLGTRMRPNSWRRQSRRSIFAEAWAASGTIAELAFAG